ncbi:MAG TPA: acyl dehydratase [Gammaproteobacteria bacterium]|nr:acyl dehydratase [Gammaproteobacteria bacterium]
MQKVLEPASNHVDFESILNYADVTQDYNPIHVDKEFAAKSPMGGIIAHGTMSLALIWQSLKKTLGADVVNRVRLDIRFVSPVRIDDTVTGGGKLQEGSDQVYDVWVKNQGGQIVIKGTAEIKTAL